MKFDPNPKKAGRLKGQIHFLIDKMWSNKKEARKFLDKKFGRNTHISKINNEKKLQEIFNTLWVESFKLHE